MLYFNDVLGVNASILIKSSGGNLSDYFSVFRGTGKVFLNRWKASQSYYSHYQYFSAR